MYVYLNNKVSKSNGQSNFVQTKVNIFKQKNKYPMSLEYTY